MLTCAGVIWWPVGGMAEVCLLLEEFVLSTYAAKFEEQEYDNVEFLFKISPPIRRHAQRREEEEAPHRDKVLGIWEGPSPEARNCDPTPPTHPTTSLHARMGG